MNGNLSGKIRKARYVQKGDTVSAYYPGSDIMMYEINMVPLDGEKHGYSLPMKKLVSFLRKNSGLCALVNNDAVKRGVNGSAAMIHYIYNQHLHGDKDEKFMYGSTDAVRSRIKKIEDLSVYIAADNLKNSGEFSMFEAGTGFLRIPFLIVSEMQDGNLEGNFHYDGAERDREVFDVISKIVEHEDLTDSIHLTNDDASSFLNRSEKDYSMVLAEGVTEYMPDDEAIAFMKKSYNRLKEGGNFVGTATNVIPKKFIAKRLGFDLIERSPEEFSELITEAGFSDLEIVQTDPPNISIGVAMK